MSEQHHHMFPIGYLMGTIGAFATYSLVTSTVLIAAPLITLGLIAPAVVIDVLTSHRGKHQQMA